jgi:hypothetical protein
MQTIQTVCPTDPVNVIVVSLCIVVGGSVIGLSLAYSLMMICRGIYKAFTQS